MTVEELAGQINEEANNSKYRFVIGTLRETEELWKEAKNRQLLNESATVLLKEDPNTKIL